MSAETSTVPGGGMPAIGTSRTGDARIDPLIGGSRWDGVVTYGFPDSPSDYPASYGNEPSSNFFSISLEQQRLVNLVFAQVSAITNLQFSYVGTQTADIAFGQSSLPATAYAYSPSSGGDVWFGSTRNYRTPRVGDYSYATHFHEIGHALGLQHPHEGQPVLNPALDWLGYSIMSYRSSRNAPATGYTNETFGFPTSFMPGDILALQSLYGINYSTNSGDTVYSWSPFTGQQFINGVGQAVPGSGTGVAGDPGSNRIFMTVWDGGGIDTFDLSAYSNNQFINLLPGQGSTFYDVQRANLGSGRYAHNVYTSFLPGGDTRAIIENVISGSGNDTIRANQADNRLDGGAGDDFIFGYAGNDILIGGSGHNYLYGGTGTDTAFFNCNYAEAVIVFNSGGKCSIFTPGAVDKLYAIELLQFRDLIVSLADLRPIDLLAPTISYTDNIVVHASNALFSFNEQVSLGSGRLHIYYEDGTLYRSIDASEIGYNEDENYFMADSRGVYFDNDRSFELHYPTNPGGYYIVLDPSFVVDAAGNPFQGLSGSTAWNFWVGRVDDFPNVFNSVTSGRLTVGGLPIVGYINDANDSDTFSVTLASGQLYEVFVDYPGPNPALCGISVSAGPSSFIETQSSG